MLQAIADGIYENELAPEYTFPDKKTFIKKVCGSWVQALDPRTKKYGPVCLECGDMRNCPTCRSREATATKDRFVNSFDLCGSQLNYMLYDNKTWENVVKYINDKDMYWATPQNDNKMFVILNPITNRGWSMSFQEIMEFDYDNLLLNFPEHRRRSGKLAEPPPKPGKSVQRPAPSVFKAPDVEFKGNCVVPSDNEDIRIAQAASLRAIDEMFVSTEEDVEKMLFLAADVYERVLISRGYKVMWHIVNVKITALTIQYLNDCATDFINRRKYFQKLQVQLPELALS